MRHLLPADAFVVAYSISPLLRAGRVPGRGELQGELTADKEEKKKTNDKNSSGEMN